MLRSLVLRKLLLCFGLELAALMGAPLRPDEIEDLMRMAHQSRIECSVLEDQGDTVDPALPTFRNNLRATRQQMDGTQPEH